MNKDEVLGVVKQWITLDDEIKQLQKMIREKKNIKKQATEALVTTKKHLLQSLATYFKGNDNQAKELSKFIMNTREENITENIRRKVPK